jgi:hypothetical protein
VADAWLGVFIHAADEHLTILAGAQIGRRQVQRPFEGMLFLGDAKITRAQIPELGDIERRHVVRGIDEIERRGQPRSGRHHLPENRIVLAYLGESGAEVHGGILRYRVRQTLDAELRTDGGELHQMRGLPQRHAHDCFHQLLQFERRRIAVQCAAFRSGDVAVRSECGGGMDVNGLSHARSGARRSCRRNRRS